MKGKKCFGLLLLFFIIFGVSLGVSSGSASALWTADYGVRHYEWSNYECSNEQYDENHTYNSVFYGCQVSAVVPISQETTSNGDTMVYSGKFNLVKRINSQRTNQFYQNLHLAVRSLYFGNYTLSLSQPPTIQYWITDWERNGNSYQTLTVKWSVVAHNNSITNTTGRVRITFYADNNSGRFDAPGATNNSGPYYFENTNEPLTVYFIDTGGSSSDTIINQNSTMIQQNQNIDNSINNVNQTLQEQQQQDNQDRQDMQNASEDAQTGADSSQQSATTTGTTLLGAFSAFVNAIINASPSNCNIDMDMGNLDLGVIDFCTLSLPQPFPTIASIFLIMFCVPLSIATARKVISLFRSFQ